MCKCCEKRKRKFLPEPKPPDRSALFAVVFVSAAIPFPVLQLELGLLVVVSLASAGLTYLYLNGLLKPLPPYIESAFIVDTSYSEKEKTIFYSIAVAAGRPRKNYTIDRRYSMFDELREVLDMPNDGLFPPKTKSSWFSKLSKEDEEVRRRGLDEWLIRIVERMRVGGSKEDVRSLAYFLDVPVDKPRTLGMAFKEMTQKHDSNPAVKTDSEVVRELVDAGGEKISTEDLVKQFDWSIARAEKVLTHFIDNGDCWIDTQDPKGQRWCWFISATSYF